jgi:hypothetical protein
MPHKSREERLQYYKDWRAKQDPHYREAEKRRLLQYRRHVDCEFCGKTMLQSSMKKHIKDMHPEGDR